MPKPSTFVTLPVTCCPTLMSGKGSGARPAAPSPNEHHTHTSQMLACGSSDQSETGCIIRGCICDLIYEKLPGQLYIIVKTRKDDIYLLSLPGFRTLSIQASATSTSSAATAGEATTAAALSASAGRPIAVAACRLALDLAGLQQRQPNLVFFRFNAADAGSLLLPHFDHCPCILEVLVGLQVPGRRLMGALILSTAQNRDDHNTVDATPQRHCHLPQTAKLLAVYHGSAFKYVIHQVRISLPFAHHSLQCGAGASHKLSPAERHDTIPVEERQCQ